MKMAILGGCFGGAALVLLMYSAVPAVHAQTGGPYTLDGPTLYKEHCAVCHGDGGRGDGPMAKFLVAKTPDLRDIARNHGGKFPRIEIENIISGETPLVKGHGSRDMPLWGPIFSEVTRDIDVGRMRIDNIARYLETLQAK